MSAFTRITATVALCAASLTAQQTFDLPTLRFNPQNNNFTFAGPVMRYQQWFSAAEWQARSADQIRVIGVDFFAGPGAAGPAGRIVDVEVTMANAMPTTWSSRFQSNFVSGEVTVFPRGNLTLLAPGAAAFPVRIPFQNEFVWDGSSGVVIEIRIFDNGNQGTAYTYDLEYLAFTQGRCTRLYTPNDPNATVAQTISAGTGLTMRFSYETAITWPYGQGCAGEGNFVPLHGADCGLPIPGNSAYGLTLSAAASQRNAAVSAGFSDTTWGPLSLPYDLGVIGAPGCAVLAEPIATVMAATVGGGPGSGIARLPFPLPPTTNYLGVPFYTQFIVLDPAGPNGLLATSNAVKHIPGPR